MVVEEVVLLFDVSRENYEFVCVYGGVRGKRALIFLTHKNGTRAYDLHI